MRVLATMASIALVLGSCAGKYEQLAKCSADDNPVPALGYGPKPQASPSIQAVETFLPDECGSMRPVNQF